MSLLSANGEVKSCKPSSTFAALVYVFPKRLRVALILKRLNLRGRAEIRARNWL